MPGFPAAHYQMHDHHGNRYYGATGLLLRVTDDHGNATNFAYSGGRLTSITGSALVTGQIRHSP